MSLSDRVGLFTSSTVHRINSRSRSFRLTLVSACGELFVEMESSSPFRDAIIWFYSLGFKRLLVYFWFSGFIKRSENVVL